MRRGGGDDPPEPTAPSTPRSRSTPPDHIQENSRTAPLGCPAAVQRSTRPDHRVHPLNRDPCESSCPNQAEDAPRFARPPREGARQQLGSVGTVQFALHITPNPEQRLLPASDQRRARQGGGAMRADVSRPSRAESNSVGEVDKTRGSLTASQTTDGGGGEGERRGAFPTCPPAQSNEPQPITVL